MVFLWIYEREYAYNLFHLAESFVERARQCGYICKGSADKNYDITKRIIPTEKFPISEAHIGEIVANGRFLILFISHRDDSRNKEYNHAISGLQKLASKFNLDDPKNHRPRLHAEC